MAVYIENESKTRFDFHYRVTIQKAVETVLCEKNIPGDPDVNVLIVSPERIREINRETRNLDQVTDVLSFPYYEFSVPGVFPQDETDSAPENILGDIVLCGDRVLSQAEEYGHSRKRELAFLVVHSMLHIIGYDHMEAEDAAVMEEEQRRMMEILGISR